MQTEGFNFLGLEKSVISVSSITWLSCIALLSDTPIGGDK